MKKSMSKQEIFLENPSYSEALHAIRTGTSKRKTTVVVGNCIVDYDGRASSKLSHGERIVILKSDGSALVHRPLGYAPVNWQPPGSLFRTKIDESTLTIRVFRKKENEVLEVKFDDVKMVAVMDLKDVGEFHLYASEEDMKRAIVIQPSILEEGFRPISTERPVEPGFIDILGMDTNNVLTVVEIKRKYANMDAVLQLKKYVDAFKVSKDINVRGILVAPGLAKGTQSLLASLGLEFKSLSPQICSEIIKRNSERSLTDFF